MTDVKRKLFDHLIKQLASRLGLCLWPGDECNNKAIRAHSIQNRNVLEVLCRNGHIVMPRLEMTLSKPPTFLFREVGRNKATTFNGLCADHDHAMFQAIEVDTIDLTNRQHLFLLAYRALLKEAHATRKSAIDSQLTYLRGVEMGLYLKDEPCPPGMLAVESMMSAYLVEEVRRQFNKAFLSENWNRVGHEVAVLEVAPALAVSSMFSVGIFSEISDGPAFVTLNVFPANRKTVVVFSYLEEHRPEVLQAYGHIWAASGHYKQYELSKLILRKCENFVLAPDLYDAFSERQKRAVIQYFERNSATYSYETDDPNLFIFSAVTEQPDE